MLIAIASAVALHSCPIDRARYALRADPSVTAEFHPTARNHDWPSGITFAIHVAKTGRSYWWLPWNGGTDDLQNIRLTQLNHSGQGSTGEAKTGGDLQFWTTDSSYNFLDSVPKAGEAAPAHIFIPSLGRTLYYYTMQTRQADNVPRAFFDLVACGKPNAPADVELLPVA